MSCGWYRVISKFMHSCKTFKFIRINPKSKVNSGKNKFIDIDAAPFQWHRTLFHVYVGENFQR